MIKASLKILSVILFIAGILFAGWSLLSLYTYFDANCANFLPPAGSVINGPESFSFAVMSDSGDRHEPIKEIAADIKKQQVNFVLHLGDQARRIQPGHYESLLQDWHQHFGSLPFYAIPGNHDAIKDRKANYNYYQRAFGQLYYWFAYGDTMFIALNTAESALDKTQQQWLKTVLATFRPDFKNCIIYMHVPPKDPRPNESYAMRANVEDFKAIIAGQRISAIICGHIHEYHAADFEGIPLYIVPPSGQRMRGKTKIYGYLLCTMKPDGKLQVKNIGVTDNKGRSYYKFILASEIDGRLAAMISFAAFTAAFVLLFASTIGSGVTKKDAKQT